MIKTLLFTILTCAIGYSQPVITTPSPLTICDDNNDGFSVFDLTVKDMEITGGQSGLVVAYFETLTDAQNNISAVNASNYFNISNPQTLYVRVSENVNPASYSTTELTIQVFPVPVVFAPNDYELCDGPENDGFATFDLSVVIPQLLFGDPNNTVGFYETLTDAMVEANPLPYIYNNISPWTQTIYARVTNSHGCYDIVTFELRVNPVPQVTTPPDMVVYESPTDGMAIFDLTQQTQVIVGGAASLFVDYYLTQADAYNDTNQIASPQAFMNFTNPQTIWAAAHGAATGCANYVSFQLIVTDQMAVPEHGFAVNISLYPNPVGELLNLNSDSEISSIEVFDIGGRLIAGKTVAGKAATFDLQQYSSGIYFVKIGTINGTAFRRIVKK